MARSQAPWKGSCRSPRRAYHAAPPTAALKPFMNNAGPRTARTMQARASLKLTAARDHSSTANANNTFPGRPTNPASPDNTYIIPPATTGPGPSNDAPVPGTPFTVSKLRFASNVQITSPVSAEYARNPPSADPENTAPGTAVTAAACVAL